MLKKFRIKKRLTVSFITVSIIASIAGIAACIAMFYLANRYDYALVNYGFAQGDIGKAMTVFSDCRSATRAVIGYTEQKYIDQALADHEEKSANVTSYMEIMSKTLTSDEEKQAYKNIETALNKYWALDDEIIELGNTTDEEKSIQAQMREAEELTQVYNETYNYFVQLMETNVNTGNELQTTLSTLRMVLLFVIIAIIILALIGSTIMGSNIATGIAKPLQALSDRLKTFAAGDLGSEFPKSDSQDEVTDMVTVAANMAENLTLVIKDAKRRLVAMANGDYTEVSEVPERYVGDFEELHTSIHSVNENMNETLHQIEEASSQVSAGAVNLSEASQSLAEGATEQAGSVEELSATIMNISDAVNQTAVRMSETYKMSADYAAEANSSRDEMQKMVKTMGRISETSQKIGSIISEIESIASQTNLLSLNASIEAARAGEAGRGFAVVADQIGKLADESAKSAVNTKELIISAIDEIKEGTQAADRTAEKIEEVVGGINQISDTSKEISELASSQADAMKQAEQGIEQITEVIQANSATAEEASATSEELSAQAETMDELIKRFRLNSK